MLMSIQILRNIFCNKNSICLTNSGGCCYNECTQNKEKRGNNMDYDIALKLGPIAALVLVILLYVKVMPRKLNGTFNKPFLQFLHDFFHFKKLYLEEVLKFIFTLATLYCVVTGALLMISEREVYSYYSYYYGNGSTRSESTFVEGVHMLVLGPVILRLAYELVMMLILLVKNVMEINNKLKANGTVQPSAPAAPAAPAAPTPAPAAPAPAPATQNPFREEEPEPANTPSDF